MAFTPRTFDDLLSEMISYVQSQTDISDFSPGSVIRTYLEANAFEQDEIYFQMTELLKDFNLTSASREGVIRRLSEFNLSPKPATNAIGQVVFYDTTAVTDIVSTPSLAGTTSVQLFNTGNFPTNGYPYTVRIGEGTVRVQDVLVTNNNTLTNTFSVTSPLTFNVNINDRATLVTGASNRTINLGTQVQAPPTTTESAKIFKTLEPAFISAGNFYSQPVNIQATESGTSSNVGSFRITQFTGSPPFTGCAVVNLRETSGGSNEESTEDFLARGLERISTLARGTPLAIKSASVGVVDVNSGKTSLSSSIFEDFANDEIILYVDDGTGEAPEQSILPISSLSVGPSAGSFSITLASSADFPSSGSVLIAFDGANAAELVSYTSKVGNSLSLSSALANNHNINATVYFVQTLTSSAEAGQRRFVVNNPPIIRNSLRVFVKPPASAWALQTQGTDYIVNRGTGEIQFTNTSGLASGTQVVVNYSYYTNLLAEVQRVLEGDENDPVNYPGVKASGVFLSVEPPIIKRVSASCSITADTGYLVQNLIPNVQFVLEQYINSRKIGEDIVLSSLIAQVRGVTGVADVTFSEPTSNIIVLEGELPKAFDINGNSLVTVS